MHPVHPPSPVARRFAGRLFGLGILLALAACGEVSSFVDASTGGDDTVDASTAPDAAPDAIAAGTVNVTTYTRCCTTAGIQAGGYQVFAGRRRRGVVYNRYGCRAGGRIAGAIRYCQGDGMTPQLAAVEGRLAEGAAGNTAVVGGIVVDLAGRQDSLSVGVQFDLDAFAKGHGQHVVVHRNGKTTLAALILLIRGL